MDSLLRVRGLSKAFGALYAVKSVDMDVAPNEVRCLIGPNGAGKSTFFKALSGQIIPTSGSIHFNGVNITKTPRYKIARLGMGIKNQVPALLEGISVYESIWLASNSGTRRGSVKAESYISSVLGRLNIGHLKDESVDELAHGQRQWVEIAMVLAARPALVLLDEPAAGLSDPERKRLVRIIHEIRETCAVIVVEHDMKFIGELESIITVFHAGDVICQGSYQHVMNDDGVRRIYLG